MMEKIATFMMTIGLIVWEGIDLAQGTHPTLSGILIGIFSLMGLFEIAAIAEEFRKQPPRNAGGSPNVPEVCVG